MIALAGTPRAWREVGNLLAVVQHKAQVKFWSMVLEPGAGESARGEMLAAARPFESSLTDDAATCPVQSENSRENRVASSFSANRRAAFVSVQSKAKAEHEAESAPASHAGLIARAPKAPRGEGGTESLLRSRNVWESQPQAIAGNGPVSLVLPAAATLPHTPANDNESFRFVLIPSVNPAVSALTEKEAALQFKLMKKSLEDGKLLRQRNRLPLRVPAAPPVS
jgi:hypothetical protein